MPNQDKAQDKAEQFRIVLALLPPGYRDGWEREYRFAAIPAPPLPSRRWRSDWAHTGARLLVEIDGGQWAPRGGRHASDKDREKGMHAAARGWRMMHISPKMLRDDPAGIAVLVQVAMDGGRNSVCKYIMCML